MLIGELEYDDMVERSRDMLKGNLTLTKINESFVGSLDGIKIEDEPLKILFSFTDHLLIGVFIFFMAIIMINLLFGLAVTDVQVLNKYPNDNYCVCPAIIFIYYLSSFIPP